MDYPSRVRNHELLDFITSGDNSMEKRASTAVSEYTRLRVRDTGIWRHVIEPIPVTDADLTPQDDTDKNVILCEMDVESAGAKSVPYNTLPDNELMRGQRYRVVFDRVMSKRYEKDVAELRSYTMDLRQVVADNAIKDLLDEEDGKALRAVGSLIGAPGSTVPETGTVQNRNYTGALDRVGWVEGLKTIQSTPNALSPATVLLNHLTVLELSKWGRDEVGGDLAEEIARNGFALRTFFGYKLLVTIKRDLVPDGTLFYFAGEKFLGKFFVLEDTTMSTKAEDYFISFFAYEEIGSTIANVAAVARVNYSGTIGSDTTIV